MGGINRSKISLTIYNQLEKKGLLKSINVLRDGENAFKEKCSDLYVCTIKAYYHKNNLKLTLDNGDAATVNRGNEDKLLVTFGDESKKIKQDDYFTLNDVKYKIIDLGNVEDIIFDMSLERV